MPRDRPTAHEPTSSARRNWPGRRDAAGVTGRCPACGRPRSRRRFLGTLGAASVAAVAGCLGGGGGDGTVPEPVALDGGKQCDVCGMVIADHPGPNGQTFYREHAPATHDNPAWFDSVREQFAYHFEKQRRGWAASVLYATDYSTVDYRVRREGDQAYISTAVAPASFGDARDLDFVVGSDVHGAMGRELIPFSDGDDAAAFVEEYGGEVVPFDAVDAGTLARQ